MKEITVPVLGESISEATVARWVKNQGDSVNADELLVELETDKVTLEINAPISGVVAEILAQTDETVKIGQVIGIIEESSQSFLRSDNQKNKSAQQKAGASQLTDLPPLALEKKKTSLEAGTEQATKILSPAARKILEENQISPFMVPARGKGGRVTKKDVLAYQKTRQPIPPKTETIQQKSHQPSGALHDISVKSQNSSSGTVQEERIKITRLRQRIAERLKEAQNTAAILTTFNEVDMSSVLNVRSQAQDRFQEKHGIKLGFMSFFVKACIAALKEVPEMNAEIQGNELVYKNHYDIGVAVGTDQGLVVPVVYNADRLNFAQIEQKIANLALKARGGTLAMQDLTGGTFTISNGGVYGSLLSTPILNPPQSGILGLHKIQKRPVVIEDKVEIRPMMYLALSYDHRIIDGQGAVTFLVLIKKCIEDLGLMLLDV